MDYGKFVIHGEDAIPGKQKRFDMHKIEDDIDEFEINDVNPYKAAEEKGYEPLKYEQTSYRQQFEHHRKMQVKVKDAIGENSVEGDRLNSFRSDLNKIWTALNDVVKSTPTEFRLQMAEMVRLYDSLIFSCEDFINNTSFWNIFERNRVRMVREVLEQAKQERVHFVDIGAGLKVFEERVGGMVLGNILGSLLTERKSIDVTNQMAEAEKNLNDDGYYCVKTRDEDSLVKSYYLNQEAYKLSDKSKGQIGMYRICEFFGVGNLCAKSELAMGIDSKGKKHFGHKVEDAYAGEEKSSLKMLQSLVATNAFDNETTDIHMEYTTEAIKNLSTIFLLRLFAGRKNINNTDDIEVIYSVKEFKGQEKGQGKKIFTVTGAFLKNSDDLFSDMKASNLEKGTDYFNSMKDLPIPVLDQDIVASFAAANMEDFQYLLCDLGLSSDQMDAMSSRLKFIKDSLFYKYDDIDKPLEERSIIKASEWDDPKAMAILQEKLRKSDRSVFPQVIHPLIRIEGSNDKSQTEVEHNYYEIYNTVKTGILNERDPMEAFRMLARFVTGAANGSMDNFAYKGSDIGNDLAARLIQELLSPKMLKAMMDFKYTTNLDIVDTYNKLDEEIRYVPQEFIDLKVRETKIENDIKAWLEKYNKPGGYQYKAEMIREAMANKVDKEIKHQYICYLVEQTKPEFFTDIFMLDQVGAFLPDLAFNNKTMKFKNLDPKGLLLKYERELIKEEGADYLNYSEQAGNIHKLFGKYNLLNKDKVLQCKEKEKADSCAIGFEDFEVLKPLMTGGKIAQ